MSKTWEAVIESAYDPATDTLKTTIQNPSSIMDLPYDEFDVTYVPSGNGVGEVSTITYKLAGTTQRVVTFTYDSSNRVIHAERA